MCVIIHKPAGVAVDETILYQCHLSNSDGCGYVASTPSGEVFMQKGFRDDDSLLAGLENDCNKYSVDRDELEMILHFRIATAGVINVVNTHPYIIHAEDINLNQAYGLRHQVLAHNGHVSIPAVFGVDTAKLKTYSDSYLLARDVLSHMSTSLRFRVLDKMAKSNRFAVMMPSGSVKRFGSWEYEDKVWYSNTWWYYSRSRYTANKLGYLGSGYYSGVNRTVSSSITTKKNHPKDYTKPEEGCYHVATYADGNDHLICENCGGNLTIHCKHEYIYGEDGGVYHGDASGVCAICYEYVGLPHTNPDLCEHPRIRWIEGEKGAWYKECPDCFDTTHVVYQDSLGTELDNES